MVVAFARSPMVTAYSAWDLARMSGGRFQLGIASQVRGNIVGRFSMEWSEPVVRLGDYVGALRAIFQTFQTGEDLAYAGAHYRFDRLQPYFNPGPNDHPAPPIWTGGVNRGMCVLAGKVADGFVCHPTSSHPRMLESVVMPALAEGAQAAGRGDGGPAVVAGPQPIIAATQDELARLRETRRSELGFLYSTPAYRRQLVLFGLEDVGEALTEMAHRSTWDELAGLMTDDVIGTLVPQGTFDDIATLLEDWYAGRCDGLVLTLPVPEDDGNFADVVARCREIRPSAR